MRIGGLQRFTLIDFPGRVAAIVFTEGCNFRCPYCYNRELVVPGHYAEPIPEEEVQHFLESRRGQLEGVVITGGEPTVQEDLADFIRRVRGLGFLVKLDTNGSHPEAIARLLEAGLLDYVAMDIKAPLARYREVTRSEVGEAAIRASVDLLMRGVVDHEFRTTVVREQLSLDEVVEIARGIRGARRYALQKFRAANSLVDPAFARCGTYSDVEFEALRRRIAPLVQEVIVR